MFMVCTSLYGRTDRMSAEGAGHIKAAVAASIADMDDLGLSGPDRVVALAVVLASRLGLTTASPTPTAPGTPPRHGGGNGGGAGGETEPLAKIAAVTKIGIETLELIYDVSDGDLKYVISAKKLASGKAEATRQLARIVALGRQAAGIEEWTASSTIREVVSDYGKFDPANFASHVMGLDKDNAIIVRGKGAAREIKITRSGIESMSDAIKELMASA